MLHKVAVHADAVFIRVQLHPILLQIGDVISFLQEKNIAGNFRSGVLFECVVGQADGSYQVGALGEIAADSGIFLVHRAF